MADYSNIPNPLTANPTFTTRLIAVGLFPALAILFGTSLVGLAAIPIISAIRGFTLAFSLTIAFSTADAVGKLELLKLKAPSTLIAVPILLILSAQGFLSSFRLLKLANRMSVPGQIYGSRYWFKVIVCAVALIIIAMFL
jgi:hypothetical protein